MSVADLLEAGALVRRINAYWLARGTDAGARVVSSRGEIRSRVAGRPDPDAAAGFAAAVARSHELQRRDPGSAGGFAEASTPGPAPRRTAG